LGYLAWRLTEPLRRRRSNPPPEAAEWQPDTEAALALLEDADRLAALGRYEEATHLLLRRSVEHIAEARPGLLEPSTTARDIAGLPCLPGRAGRAFRVIADRVERSLFALRGLSAEDWQQARAAYAEFALALPAACAAPLRLLVLARFSPSWRWALPHSCCCSTRSAPGGTAAAIGTAAPMPRPTASTASPGWSACSKVAAMKWLSRAARGGLRTKACWS